MFRVVKNFFKNYSERNSTQCVKNSCGVPRIFSPKQIRFGAQIEPAGRSVMNTVVTAKCPEGAKLKCDGPNTTKCVWDGKKLAWDNRKRIEYLTFPYLSLERFTKKFVFLLILDEFIVVGAINLVQLHRNKLNLTRTL